MNYEANGKIENEIKKIKGLESLIGLKKVKILKSISAENIDDKLSDMTLVDLQKMAVEMGLSGGGDRMVLKNKIKNEFIKYKNGYGGTALSIQC